MSNRHKAREAAVQSIYQWDMMGCPVNDLNSEFMEDMQRNELDQTYLKTVLQGVASNQELIEKAIRPFIDRDFAKVDPIERSILRLGVYELLFHRDVPAKVILNESIELAKTFGSDHSYKFINGTMDKLAQEKSVVALRS